MKKYIIPEIEINYFKTDDIMTLSSNQITYDEQGMGGAWIFSEVWGSKI